MQGKSGKAASREDIPEAEGLKETQRQGSRQDAVLLSRHLPLRYESCVLLLPISPFSSWERSKQALTGFALYCLLAFLVAGRISMRQVSFLLVLSPLLLCLVTGVSEHTSGRLSGYPTRFVMQYHAFRYDLSDLAITIAERETEDPERGLEEGWKVVREALEMAVPSVLSGGYGKESGKPTELDAYRNQLSGIGLYPDADDYNDTFFSMGAQLLGYPGIFHLSCLCRDPFPLRRDGRCLYGSNRVDFENGKSVRKTRIRTENNKSTSCGKRG